MCMRVCIRVCVCVCAHTYIHLHTHTHTHIHTHTHMHNNTHADGTGRSFEEILGKKLKDYADQKMRERSRRPNDLTIVVASIVFGLQACAYEVCAQQGTCLSTNHVCVHPKLGYIHTYILTHSVGKGAHVYLHVCVCK